MNYEMIGAFKSNYIEKGFDYSYDDNLKILEERLSKYKDNLKRLPFTKKFININKIFIKDEKDLSKYSSLYFSDISISEIGDFLISGGLIWSFPVFVNDDNKYEALGQIDKLLALKRMLSKGKLSLNFAVMCYIIDPKKIESTSEYYVIIPKEYYQLWYAPDFFYEELKKRKDLEYSNEISDSFFLTKNFDMNIIETFNYFSDEILSKLYKKNKERFMSFTYDKMLIGVEK
jgi:hypothetical protein